MTLFQDEIPEAIGKTLDLITSPGTSDEEGRFSADPIKRIRIYSSRHGEDPLYIKEAAHRVIKGKGLIDKVDEADDSDSAIDDSHVRNFGYSSIHIIAEVEVGVADNQVRCLTEIQIRSVFEDAWGEISHRLVYGPGKTALKSEQSDTAGISKRGLEGWKLHLCALKAVVDGCVQHADLINRDFLRSQVPPGDGQDDKGEPPDLPQPIAPLSEESFASCAQSIREAVRRALKLRAEAEETASRLDGSKARRGPKFSDAAQAFAEARVQLKTTHGPGRSSPHEMLDRELAYEEAYCLMFSDNAESIDQAEKAYLAFVQEDLTNPIAAYRLGQIYTDRQDFAAAKDQYEDALKRLQSSKLDETHWLRGALPRHLGYVCWRLSEKTANEEEKLALLEYAYDMTKKALQIPKPTREGVSHNNLLYYAWYIVTLSPEHARRSELEEAIRYHLSKLHAIVNIETDDTGATRRRLDTMMRAESYLGNKAAAVALANRLITLIDSTLYRQGQDVEQREREPTLRELEGLSEDDRDTYLYALRVLRRFLGRSEP